MRTVASIMVAASLALAAAPVAQASTPELLTKVRAHAKVHEATEAQCQANDGCAAYQMSFISKCSRKAARTVDCSRNIWDDDGDLCTDVVRVRLHRDNTTTATIVAEPTCETAAAKAALYTHL